MIQQKLDTLLASHTAPTLMGVKPANLVSLPRFETFEQMVQNYNAHLNQQDIYFHPVCQCNCKQLLLVYRKSEHYVNHKNVLFYYLTVIPYIIKTMFNYILMKFCPI